MPPADVARQMAQTGAAAAAPGAESNLPAPLAAATTPDARAEGAPSARKSVAAAAPAAAAGAAAPSSSELDKELMSPRPPGAARAGAASMIGADRTPHKPQH